MNFRLANFEDRDIILKMLYDGHLSLKKDGVDQWQGDSFPNLSNYNDLILNKEIFVLEDESPVSTVVLLEYDKDYDTIYNGNWINSGSYLAMHKVAILGTHTNKGYAKILFREVEIYAKKLGFKSLRIDTHEDNFRMKSLIEKCGFKYCGIVYIDGTLKRVAFEKILY